MSDPFSPLPDLLTTKEVAELLRIKQRKVYELVSAGQIPVSRVTGKLLFPRDLVEAWVRAQAYADGGFEHLKERPAVLAGSHDPLLEWALRESGSEIATFFDSSLDGLRRVAEGRALGAGLHVFEPEHWGNGDWNINHVRRGAPGLPLVLIEWARRRQGLILPAGNPLGIEGLQDLPSKTVISRQKDSGSHLLFQHLLRKAEIAENVLGLLPQPARSETDLALAVAEGRADAGFGVESVARQQRLDFLPLWTERFDLLLWRHAYFEPPVQKLLAFARTKPFAQRAKELRGYSLRSHGEVHYNGP